MTKKDFIKKITNIAKSQVELIAGIAQIPLVTDFTFRRNTYCGWCKKKFRKNNVKIPLPTGLYHNSCFATMMGSEEYKKYQKAQGKVIKLERRISV